MGSYRIQTAVDITYYEQIRASQGSNHQMSEYFASKNSTQGERPLGGGRQTILRRCEIALQL